MIMSFVMRESKAMSLQTSLMDGFEGRGDLSISSPRNFSPPSRRRSKLVMLGEFCPD
jgi:hypothetical protein